MMQRKRPSEGGGPSETHADLLALANPFAFLAAGIAVSYGTVLGMSEAFARRTGFASPLHGAPAASRPAPAASAPAASGDAASGGAASAPCALEVDLQAPPVEALARPILDAALEQAAEEAKSAEETPARAPRKRPAMRQSANRTVRLVRKPADGKTGKATGARRAASVRLKRPYGLEAPRAGKADDLKLISGIGERLETVLNDLGIYHFDQIAAWSEAEIAWIDDYLHFKGRVKRSDWLPQAQRLMAAAR
ncbi:hypothetical protein [Afifella pfennigii]|uniref:hypothetical protein n=1 Tax=Afifella pfennigii TaxID=209897 RepID=UPI00068A5422|nr:hypothetical protein [Afifella pfennigii]